MTPSTTGAAESQHSAASRRVRLLSGVRAHITYANLIATIAVFVALGGSSYAALRVTGENVPKDALTGADITRLTGRDVRNNSLTGADIKGLTSADVVDGRLLAEDFAPGQLPRGTTGERGRQGPAGPAGPGFDTGLPSRRTLRGVYSITGFSTVAGDYADEAVTYAAALPSNPTVHTIADGATPPDACPGTVAAPEAAPGHLCLYESKNHTVNRQSLTAYVDPKNAAEGRYGFHISMLPVKAGAYSSLGTWAVTAP